MMPLNRHKAGLMMASLVCHGGDLAALGGSLERALEDRPLDTAVWLPHRLWLTSRADNS
jgi:hypothetical protein